MSERLSFRETLRRRVEGHLYNMMPAPEQATQAYIGVIKHEAHNSKVYRDTSILFGGKAAALRPYRMYQINHVAEYNDAVGILRNSYEEILLYKQGKVLRFGGTMIRPVETDNRWTAQKRFNSTSSQD